MHGARRCRGHQLARDYANQGRRCHKQHVCDACNHTATRVPVIDYRGNHVLCSMQAIRQAGTVVYTDPT